MSDNRQFKRSEYCHTCGALRGMAPYRESVSIHELVSTKDHKELKHDPSQGITFEQSPQLVVHVGVWRNGGADGVNSFLCDDCMKIGLRRALEEIKVLLGDEIIENPLPLLGAYRFVFSRGTMHDNEAMSALKTWQPAMFELIMGDIEKENRIMKPRARD